MFILRLPLAVFSLSVKVSNLGLASKAKIVLHYSYLCAHFFQADINTNLTLPFAVMAILNLSIIDIQVTYHAIVFRGLVLPSPLKTTAWEANAHGTKTDYSYYGCVYITEEEFGYKL